MTRTLLYGGSFDPPHIAHIKVPHAAMEYLKFDRVLYVPAFQSPLKKTTPTSATHRLAMLQLAHAGCPWAAISTIELDRGGTSFTIDTIDSLLDSCDELRLLIGADQWLHFKEWHRWEDIISLANPAIMPRIGFELSDPRVLKIKPLPGSSTAVREKIGQTECSLDFIQPEVAAYIAQHGLYL
ncbi:MAG: nicotinate (nicotinamide) nucleotide adenylyltransferase [Planctomycetes bacterium]|nr:nicotinate (nicotinamide) nucleotide adenylyltransferase [Planctomycetota bacterium]